MLGNIDQACHWLLTSCGLKFEHMQPDIEGDTPMSLAKSYGDVELENYLIEKYECLEKNN